MIDVGRNVKLVELCREVARSGGQLTARPNWFVDLLREKMFYNIVLSVLISSQHIVF